MSSHRLAARSWRHRASVAVVTFAVCTTYMLGHAATGASVAPEIVHAASQPREFVEFKTDACGDLTSIKGRQSNLIRSSAIVDPDGDDDDEDSTSAWGMSDDDWVMSKQWMLQHPDMAVETDAVEKSCANDPMDEDENGDDGGTSDIA